MADGADEPWGVLALLAAVGFAVFRERAEVSAFRLWVAAGLVGLALGIWSLVTPLVMGVFFAGALACLLADRRCWIGHAGLFFLALPLISSLQFYGGYPLRWLVGACSEFVLGLFGLEVEALGAMLRWRGEMIAIDAPCSGVQMIWASTFFACLLICIYKLDARRSLLLLQVSSVTVFLGNVARNCLLFFVESGLVELGDWAHDAIGVVAFLGVLGVVGVVGRRLRTCSRVRENAERVSRSHERGYGLKLVGQGALAVMCLWMAFASGRSSEILAEGPVADDLADSVRGDLVKEGWEPLTFDAASGRFVKSFPGTIELFGQDGRRLLARTIRRATRRYHLSADCYRALGYEIEPLPLLREPDGTLWGRVLAFRGQERIELRERVVSQDGQAWTDPSSWFWSAMLGRSQGPWVAYSEVVLR